MGQIELTETLISIPSHEDESETGDHIQGWLERKTDATVRRDEAPNGGNVIARKGSGPQTLAFVGHHDVVPPAESQVIADGSYQVSRQDGRLYGRGTADMLGAVAAGMYAFREATPPTGVELIFASFVGEEQGGIGAEYAIDHGFDPEYAIIGEGSTGYSGPGVTDIVVAHKGRSKHILTARGTQTHASVPETGTNAIYRATDAVETLKEQQLPATTVGSHEMQGTCVVTEIEGGTASNIVPDRCKIVVDERTVPGVTVDRVAVESLPGIEWETVQRLPPMACDDLAFANRCREIAEQEQSKTPSAVTKPHATDAGRLAEAGVTCIVCGPAESGEAHTDTESVSIETLKRCRQIYRAMFEQAVEPRL